MTWALIRFGGAFFLPNICEFLQTWIPVNLGMNHAPTTTLLHLDDKIKSWWRECIVYCWWVQKVSNHCSPWWRQLPQCWETWVKRHGLESLWKYPQTRLESKTSFIMHLSYWLHKILTTKKLNRAKEKKVHVKFPNKFGWEKLIAVLEN